MTHTDVSKHSLTQAGLQRLLEIKDLALRQRGVSLTRTNISCTFFNQLKYDLFLWINLNSFQYSPVLMLTEYYRCTAPHFQDPKKYFCGTSVSYPTDGWLRNGHIGGSKVSHNLETRIIASLLLVNCFLIPGNSSLWNKIKCWFLLMLYHCE